MAQPQRLRILLADGLARLGISRPHELRDALAPLGCSATLQACSDWIAGSSNVGRKRLPAFAVLLDVSLTDLVLAAADVPTGDAEQVA